MMITDIRKSYCDKGFSRVGYDAGKLRSLDEKSLLVLESATTEEEIAREKYVLIIGRVVHLEADDRFFSETVGMDLESAKPLCIISGGNEMQFARPVATGYSSGYALHQNAPR